MIPHVHSLTAFHIFAEYGAEAMEDEEILEDRDDARNNNNDDNRDGGQSEQDEPPASPNFGNQFFLLSFDRLLISVLKIQVA